MVAGHGCLVERRMVPVDVPEELQYRQVDLVDAYYVLVRPELQDARAYSE